MKPTETKILTADTVEDLQAELSNLSKVRKVVNTGVTVAEGKWIATVVMEAESKQLVEG